ncbi:hypothetical protein WME90_27420 [Sorangium sp. So ce375]|uniref:hypothetical protein n=1 Tax=Sorangium sp. So ce375 TaxID=3133306 RepID=UPI003F5B715F
MGRSDGAAAGYEPLRYRADDDAPWYHVLHGNVPEHQIDFMYGPEVPQGALTPTHFSHLARLMKYIEPQTSGAHAFAIGNLSRDDTQHEAGHGAIALIFAFRIGGATDHAGRGHPPFAHGILAIDREVRRASLLEAITSFHRRATGGGEAGSPAEAFYRAYVRAVLERPDGARGEVERYVDAFRDLPRLPRSDLPWAWVAGAEPRRIVIVHGDAEPFGSIASVASRLAAVLFRSNIRWTAITTGREADIPGGLSVRLVAERDVAPEDHKGRLLRIEQVPEDEADVARAVFGARPYGVEAPRAVGWRERYAARLAPVPGASAGAACAGPETRAEQGGQALAEQSEGARAEGRGEAAAGTAQAGTRAVAAESERDERRRAAETPRPRRWVRRAAVLGAGAALAAVGSLLGTMPEASREAERRADVAAPRGVVMGSAPALAAPAPAASSPPEASPADAGSSRAALREGPPRAPARSRQRRTPPKAVGTSEPTVFDSAPVFE